MFNPHISEKKAAPSWVAVGAPLVGVPLMVALLTLASPQTKVPLGETEGGVWTEQVQPQSTHPTELEAEFIELHRQS